MCFRYIWIPFNSNQCATWSLVIEIIPLRHHYTAPKIAIQARIVFIVAFVYFRTVTDFYLWNWIIHFINQNIIYIFRAFNSLTFNRDRNICLFWFVPCSVAPFVRFFRYLCVCVFLCVHGYFLCLLFHSYSILLFNTVVGNAIRFLFSGHTTNDCLLNKLLTNQMLHSFPNCYSFTVF